MPKGIYYVIAIITLFIVLICVWKFTPLRKWFFVLRSRTIGSNTRIRLRFRFGFIGRFRWIIRTAVDFVVFWFVFEWHEGIIWGYIKFGWLWVLDKLKVAGAAIKTIGVKVFSFICMVASGIGFITPFGRNAAENSDFRYCLIVCTICVVISLIIFFVILSDEVSWFVSGIISVVASFAMWYSSFGMCFLIVKIPIAFKILALIASVAGSFILFVIFGVLALCVAECFS